MNKITITTTNCDCEKPQTKNVRLTTNMYNTLTKDEHKNLEMSDRQHEILTGLLMGDASARIPGKNPHITLTVQNEQFIDWVTEELDKLWTGSKSVRYENQDRTNQYEIRTRTHEIMWEFRDWYESGKKRYPDDLQLTPLIAQMWYACDGNLHWANTNRIRNSTPRAAVYIGCFNESDRIEWVANLFREHGFKVTTPANANIRVATGETPEFLEWIGEPIPGYEYKWESRDYEQYKSLIQKVK